MQPVFAHDKPVGLSLPTVFAVLAILTAYERALGVLSRRSPCFGTPQETSAASLPATTRTTTPPYLQLIPSLTFPVSQEPLDISTSAPLHRGWHQTLTPEETRNNSLIRQHTQGCQPITWLQRLRDNHASLRFDVQRKIQHVGWSLFELSRTVARWSRK